jgi:alcohol dehydrogenase class IV
MQFEFATATRIIFGSGRLHEIGPIVREFGTRPLVVTGRDTNRAEPLLELLHKNGLESSIFSIAGEPTIAGITEGVAAARKQNADGVIAFGGGSALDAGKAIAIMVTNGGEVLDYLEVIGRGKPLAKPPLPCLAIPTTAGTGAEVTRNAVIGSPEHRTKASLRSSLMLPRVALVDPDLTLDLPSHITATSGMDALTQLIEPFVSSRANPLVDALGREGIPRIARALRSAFENGGSRSAREDMALASLFGGLALSNAGLGAVHGFAGPIGGMFSAPHGAICAALLPHVMDANLRALRCRQPESAAEARYTEIAQMLTGDPEARAADGVRWIEQLVSALRIPSLKTHNVAERDLDEIVLKSQKASSMKGNPIELTTDELRNILRCAL